MLLCWLCDSAGNAGAAASCHCCKLGGGHPKSQTYRQNMQVLVQMDTGEAALTLAMMSPSLVLMSARDPDGAGGLTAIDSAYTQGCPDFRVLMRSFERTRWTGAALLAIRGISCL